MSEVMEQSGSTGMEIAVIGMSGRFPGARNIEQFWENLKNGIESVVFFSKEELRDTGIDPGLLDKPNYIKSSGALLEDIEYFDADFFDYTPLEAELMDPQVRFFHECAWEVLEDAGYDPSSYHGAIGVYAGAGHSLYWEGLVLVSGKIEQMGEFATNHLANKDYLATRISYKLDLKGPAVSVQTACSTSLVAVHLACQALLEGDCDLALAGGVTISPRGNRGYLYLEDMILSSDGHCRAFAAGSTGTIMGSGAAVVLLKTLGQAIKDKDSIHAVIKGTALNNDGIAKAGYTAPSRKAQTEVIQLALQVADIAPETIEYLETHGTGTILGDPIEIEALKKAFNTTRKGFCAIGSVKTNIGHLDAAAGTAGLIKAVLALKHGLIPPGLHFEVPNPKIDFENSPFYVNICLKEWTRGSHPRRAGVSSLGIGGTNAHVILEEPPPDRYRDAIDGVRDKEDQALQSNKDQLILLSAKTRTALDKMTQNLAYYFKTHPGIPLADAAYTLQRGRKAFHHRRMLMAASLDDALKALENPDPANTRTLLPQKEKNTVIFMFSGQGSQYVNMGLELYRTEPLFREEIDRGFGILESMMEPIKHILYPSETALDANNQDKINHVFYSGPIKFIFDYSMAKLLMRWGIQPDVLMGHSFGEYAAACLAGVFSLEHALKMVVLRGRLMYKTAPGTMLGIPMSEEEITPYLNKNDGLSLAAVNSSVLCIVSGPLAAVTRLEKELVQKGVECIRINFPRASHSQLMEPILEEFAEQVGRLTFNKPEIPLISSMSGEMADPREVIRPAYWARHMRQTVRFADGINNLLKKPNPVFIQVGAGKELALYASQHPELTPETLVINVLRNRKDEEGDINYLLDKIGQLWLKGIDVDWKAFHTGKEKQRLSLPTYPFERQRYWIEGGSFQFDAKTLPGTSTMQPKQDLADWFYIPTWKRSFLRNTTITLESTPGTCWLLFADECGLGQALAHQLQEQGHKVITVTPGSSFQPGKNQFTLNPQSSSDYEQLFKELHHQQLHPCSIIHLWNVNHDPRPYHVDNKKFLQGGPGGAVFSKSAPPGRRRQEQAIYSLIYIARSIGKHDFPGDIHLAVITNNMQEVTGEDGLYPEKAAVLGPVKVIPKEYPNITCCCIDVVTPVPGSQPEKILIRQLVEELQARSGHWQGDQVEPVVAYRGRHRWVQRFDPVKLEKCPENNLRLRQGGVYLMVGGLGEMGLELARYIAGQVSCQLVLTARTTFPARDQWEHWLENPNKNPVLTQKIQTLCDIEKTGARTLVFNADAANPGHMQRVINQTHETIGPINGIIHSAGLAGGEMIQRTSPGALGPLLEAKVTGTLVLDSLFRGKDLDFFILCSSTSSILPQLGQVAYCAANAFLDAFARYKSLKDNIFTVSIGWDRWRNVGVARTVENKHKELTGQDMEGGHTKEQGVEAFSRILSENFSHIVVSTYDLEKLIRRFNTFKVSSAIENLGEIKTNTNEIKKPVLRRRPELGKEYIAPRNETEQILADTWIKFFGYETIGIRDDFFELGGDSLKALTISSHTFKKFQVNIPLAIFFENPTIEALAAHINRSQSEGNRDSFIQSVEKKDYYSMSSAQQRIYFIQQFDPDSIAYNVTQVVLLQEALDRKKLHRAFLQLIEKHESFRTSFHMIKDQPIQKIASPGEVSFEIHELEAGGSGEWLQDLLVDFSRPFNLTRAPLLRVGLVEKNPGEHLLILDMHHTISDRQSLRIMTAELMALYNDQKLPSLPIQYKDFSERQKKLVLDGTGNLKKQEEYWVKKFETQVPVINLPLDYKRPGVQDFQGKGIGFEIGKTETAALKELASNQGVTLFMVLLSIFYVLLSKISSQEDIVVGTPSEGRHQPEIKHLIGMFVNTLALRNYPAGQKTFPVFLNEVKKETLEAIENQDYQFEDLVDRIVVNRDVSRNPLFDVVFAFQAGEMQETGYQDLKCIHYEPETMVSKFDFTWEGRENKNKLSFYVEYCTKLFKKETINRFISYFKRIVSMAADNPQIQLSNIELLSLEEKYHLVSHFSRNPEEYANDKTIPQLFEQRVRRKPDSIALVGKEEGWKSRRVEAKSQELRAITYKELNEKSNGLAFLLEEKGVKPGTIVGILAERSIEMIIGIVSILKAGSAYLPIDPESPRERIKYMLADSGVSILLTTNHFSNENPFKEEILYLSDAIANVSTSPGLHPESRYAPAASLAYVIYTSGSTGIPKGVVITHRNVSPLLHWGYHDLGITSLNRALQNLSYFFDWSVWEIFIILTSGASLYMMPQEVLLDPAACASLMWVHAITVLHVTPTQYTHLVNIGQKHTTLKYLFIGAEKLTVDLVARSFESVNDDCRVFNMYGPTECTIISAVLEIDRANYHQFYELTSVPIGRPVANIMLLVLNQYMQLCPVNIVGELYIGGDCVSNGYLNNPELTGEKFLLVAEKGFYRSHTSHRSYISHKSFIYKTGDRVRWLSDGNVEFLGRLDHQVKIRGFRIELGEIETCLLAHQDIKEAVVLIDEASNDRKRLLAWIIPEKSLKIHQLLEYLAARLPGYMVPSRFFPMESFPLNPNGKIDLQQLMQMKSRENAGELTSASTYMEPGSPQENMIAQIWQEVLQVQRVGREDNFFDLGGDSIDIIKVKERLNQAFKKNVPVVNLFRYPTVGLLAGYLFPESSIEPDHFSQRREKIRQAIEKSKFTRKHKKRITGC